jgi:hypothetical protein
MGMGNYGQPTRYQVEYKPRGFLKTAALCLGGALLGASALDGCATGASEGMNKYVHSEIGSQKLLGRALGPLFAEGEIKKALRNGGAGKHTNAIYRGMRRRVKDPAPHYRNAFFGTLGGAALMAGGKKRKIRRKIPQPKPSGK